MIAIHKNPPTIYPQHASIEDIPDQWWVAHTRARHEKALAFDLLGWEVPFFLPMVEKTIDIRGRRFRSMLPLFPGYLFFGGNDDTRYFALTTSHVANVLPVPDQERLVHELVHIESALVARAKLDPFPYLKKGCLCRVRAGPLRGAEGIVVRRRGTMRLVLQIEMLGQAVATEIDPSLVEMV